MTLFDGCGVALVTPFGSDGNVNFDALEKLLEHVISGGADALSLINTLTGMRIDINSRRPIIRNNTGGLSGPAVLPVAIRMVWQTAQKVKLPIVGLGGISTPEDAVEMLLAGASAIQVGTAIFTDPYAPIKIRDGLLEFMEKNGVKSVRELTGGIKPW